MLYVFSAIKSQTSRGFTLIELMIVVAIVAIIAAVALPSYSSYVQRGNRAAAKTALLEAQQFMERYYAANNRYDQNNAGTAVALPARLQTAPAEGPKYDLSISAVDSTSFTLTATPRTGVSDNCGNLTLTNTGARNVSGTESVASCWR